MASEKKLYTVKWPRAAGHVLKSSSGVHVESNVARQLVLHFYNEIREMEDVVEYAEDGSRLGDPREIIYIREITDSILISEGTARQLRDILNSLFPAQAPEEIN